MTQICRKLGHHVDIKWSLLKRVAFFRQFFRYVWDRILICSAGKSHHSYRRLRRCVSSSLSSCPSTTSKLMMMSNINNNTSSTESTDHDHHHHQASSTGSLTTLSDHPQTSTTTFDYDTDSDLVALKISILGDCHIGKTSFVSKSVGNDEGAGKTTSLQMNGLNLVDKIFSVRGARIAFRIWDVGGDNRSLDHVPIACKDAVAIFIMFDLTSRSTLNSVIGWYHQARKWNQNAIPILIGTKFDDFVHLPLAMQCTIINQARTYAGAMKATLFFSSSTHNININKIFKFITAKLFNLPWTVERNLTIGEPIIDF